MKSHTLNRSVPACHHTRSTAASRPPTATTQTRPALLAALCLLAITTLSLPAQVINIHPQSQDISLGSPVSFNVDTTGATQFQWRLNGQNIPGETNPSLNIPATQAADGGSYSVVVADANNAITSQRALLCFIDIPSGSPADHFNDRLPLGDPLGGIIQTSNTLATAEPGEPSHTLQDPETSVWFEWTAPDIGIASFNSRGSAFDTRLAIYQGPNLASLVEIASDDDRGGFHTSSVEFNASSGTTYFVAIDGFAGDTGKLVLQWQFTPCGAGGGSGGGTPEPAASITLNPTELAPLPQPDPDPAATVVIHQPAPPLLSSVSACAPATHGSSLAAGGQGGGAPPLQVLGVTGGGLEAIVHFNQPINPASIHPSLFQIFNGPQQIPVAGALPGPGGNIVLLQLTPPTPLPESVPLVLNASGITDLEGVPMEPATHPFQAPTLNRLQTCPGTDVQLAINCNGTPPITFQWFFDGNPIPGAESNLLFLIDITPSQTGLYTAVCTSPDGMVFADYPLTIVDDIPPTITCPPGRDVEATHPTGTQVAYNISASDNCGGTLSVTCNPPPNGRFPLGDTLATCIITDASGNTNSCSFNVHVRDTTPPQIACPGDQFVQSTFPVQFHYTAGTADNSDTNPTVTCLPPSGTHFNPGQTTVSCTATDFSGNSTSCSFDITVGQVLGFVLHPLGQRAHLGGSILFESLASGAPTLNYQWFHNDAPLPGETGSNLEIPVVQLENQGIYSVEVNDGTNTVTSNPAALQLCESVPVIVSHPASQTVLEGQPALLAVQVSDNSATYQWFHNGLPVPLATNPGLLIPNTQPQNVGTYSVRINNSFGRTAHSRDAVLEIGSDPSVQSLDKVRYDPGLAGGGGSGSGGGGSGGGAFVAGGPRYRVGIGSTSSHILNNTGSTTQDPEPNHCGKVGNATRWLYFETTNSGNLHLDTAASQIPAILAVYERAPLLFGGGIASLAACATTNAPGGTNALLEFSALANTLYAVALDGVNYAEGEIHLNWIFCPTPGPAPAPNQTNILQAGQSVALCSRIDTSANPETTYQWSRNGLPIAGATQPLLLLHNVDLCNSPGTYQLQINNNLGVETSLDYVIVNPKLSIFKNPLRVVIETSLPFQLQTTGDLTPPVIWTTIETKTGPDCIFIHLPPQPAIAPRLYYRAQVD